MSREKEFPNIFIDGIEYKRCSGCGKSYPLTSLYWHKTKIRKDGLAVWCKTCMIKYRKQHYANNKEKVLKQCKIYWDEHAEERRNYSRDYRERYPEKARSAVARWSKTSHGKSKIRIYDQSRNSIKRNVISDFTVAEWETCVKHFSNRCAYCGKTDVLLTQDHFVPLSDGGEYTRNNIIPACGSCNSSKYNRNFFNWYKHQKTYSIKREMKILKYLNYKSDKQQLSILF